MGFFDTLKEFVDEFDGTNDRKKAIEKKIVDHSLTCRQCGELAKPIAGTSNRYKCTCGNQFSGAKHPC